MNKKCTLKNGPGGFSKKNRWTSWAWFSWNTSALYFKKQIYLNYSHPSITTGFFASFTDFQSYKSILTTVLIKSSLNTNFLYDYTQKFRWNSFKVKVSSQGHWHCTKYHPIMIYQFRGWQNQLVASTENQTTVLLINSLSAQMLTENWNTGSKSN